MLVNLSKLVDLAKLLRTLACLSFAMGVAVATVIGSAFAAEAPSVNQIIEALTPKHLTRSLDLGAPPTNAQDTQFLLIFAFIPFFIIISFSIRLRLSYAC